jgi:uncharacterized protein
MINIMRTDDRVEAEVAQQRYPLLFASISGAHLYGFPSPDSDYDVRGVHLLPAREIVGLYTGPDTIEVSKVVDGLEIDLVTDDLKKFCDLLLKKNGNVLEQVLSPLVIRTTPEHEELRAVAQQCITRHHAHHYRGFSENQWKLFLKAEPRRVKPLLYVYRVLLTGIHLLRTGEVEANLTHLFQDFDLPFVPDLIARKQTEGEQATLTDADLEFHESQYTRLRQLLEDAFQSSTLSEFPAGRDALHDLLVRVRLSSP